MHFWWEVGEDVSALFEPLRVSSLRTIYHLRVSLSITYYYILKIPKNPVNPSRLAALTWKIHNFTVIVRVYSERYATVYPRISKCVGMLLAVVILISQAAKVNPALKLFSDRVILHTQEEPERPQLLALLLYSSSEFESRKKYVLGSATAVQLL